MGNSVKAVGNTVAGSARFVVGDVKGSGRSFKRAGSSYKKVGKQIGNTTSDIGKAVGNTSAGIVNTTVGAVINNKKMIKRGTKQFKKAGKQTVNALVGKADITGNVVLNISKPYNMSISCVNSKHNIRQGIVGMAVVEPLIMSFKDVVKGITNTFIKITVNNLIEMFRLKLKNLTFVQDKEINSLIQQVWEPQNICCKFNNKNQICLVLNNNFITWIMEQVKSLNLTPIPPQTINLNFNHNGHIFTAAIILDFEALNVFCTINGVDKLLVEAEGLLKTKLIHTFGNKACYRCRTSINPQNANIIVNATVYLQIPL